MDANFWPIFDFLGKWTGQKPKNHFQTLPFFGQTFYKFGRKPCQKPGKSGQLPIFSANLGRPLALINQGFEGSAAKNPDFFLISLKNYAFFI